MNSDDRAEIQTMLRREIALALNVVLNGVASGSVENTENIGSMFPGMDTQQARPKVEPYGFHSRAPDGTLSVCAQVGADTASRYVIGHRDARRPVLESGEATTYSVAGYEMRVGLTTITVRKGAQVFTAVVGEPLAAVLSAMLAAISVHTHAVSIPVFSGPVPTGETAEGDTDEPDNAAAFDALKSTVDAGAILAADGGAFA